LKHFGIKRCLGYNFDAEDSSETELDFSEMLDLIHEKYRNMYLKWWRLSYAHTYEKRIPVRSLKQRFVINYPVRKASGKYVWVKEMAMPYQLDSNNMVVTQISSYTIICKFIGFHLPVAPRFYDEQGGRMVDFEETFFKQFLEDIDFKLPLRLKKVVQTIINLDSKKTLNEKEESFRTQKLLLTTAEVASHMNIAQSTMKNYFHEIHNIVEDKFGWIFRDHYDAAMFLKGLRYVRPSK
jgi:hypothetical protein